MNHELRELLGEPSIVHTAKIGRLRWAGHVVRMSDDNPVKMVFETNPMGRDSEVRSEQGGSIRWKATYGPFADSVAGELRPWTEWSGDVSYVQQKTQHGLGLIGKVR